MVKFSLGLTIALLAPLATVAGAQAASFLVVPVTELESGERLAGVPTERRFAEAVKQGYERLEGDGWSAYLHPSLELDNEILAWANAATELSRYGTNEGINIGSLSQETQALLRDFLASEMFASDSPYLKTVLSGQFELGLGTSARVTFTDQNGQDYTTIVDYSRARPKEISAQQTTSNLEPPSSNRQHTAYRKADKTHIALLWGGEAPPLVSRLKAEAAMFQAWQARMDEAYSKLHEALDVVENQAMASSNPGEALSEVGPGSAFSDFPSHLQAMLKSGALAQLGSQGASELPFQSESEMEGFFANAQITGENHIVFVVVRYAKENGTIVSSGLGIGIGIGN